MNKLIYITGVISVFIVAVIFTVNMFYEPAAAKVEKQSDFKQTYTVKELYTVTDGDKTVTDGETAGGAGENPSCDETAAESFLEPSAEGVKKYYNVPLPEELQEHIFAECEKYGIPPAVVIAMIERESTFDTFAMGDDGRAFGLMQILPKYHLEKMREMGCTALFDPYQNVSVGIAILGELMQQSNDLGWALTAYNSGPGNADNGPGTYAVAVLDRSFELEKGQGD